MLILIISLLFSIKVSSGVLYDRKYFDPKDRIRAECVVRKSMSDYEYLGNKDKSIDGESCIPWIEITETWFPTANTDQKLKKQTSENFYHSKCRNVQLKVGHPLHGITASRTLKTIGITSGKLGPWCFISKDGTDGKANFSFSPAVCFDPCDEMKIVIETERKRMTENGYTVLKLNYNPALLDPIDKLFSEYDLGDVKYYSFKKSREQPPQYLELRQRVFIVLCITFFATMIWILTCFCIKQYSQKVHRKKQKALEGFYENTNLADIKMQADLRKEREEA